MQVLGSYLSPARIGAPAARRGKAAASEPIATATYVRELILLFLASKIVLLSIASFSPGPGYDTSTDLFFAANNHHAHDYHHGDEALVLPASSLLTRGIEHVVLRLTRWDGIYFTSIAERGYVFEQEWAFGGAVGRVPVLLARVFSYLLPLPPIIAHALACICLSHLFHLGAVLALFRLTSDLLPENAERVRIAFTAACLHIISPAGLFLSAPFAESAFAFWSSAGIAIYVAAVRRRFASGAEFLDWPVTAGVVFGVATGTRSNGMLNGILPAWDLLALFLQFPPLNRKSLTALVTTVVSGCLVAVGLIVPQIFAYREYCTVPADNSNNDSAAIRPWCNHLPPSIYQWVQHHYWDVGLFRYWTPNNLPLFLLAGPMLAMLIYTSTQALFKTSNIFAVLVGSPKKASSARVTSVDERVWEHCLPRLALPQGLLAVLALLSFHVQIVNRLSSAYPVWYILLAVALHRGDQQVEDGDGKGRSKRRRETGGEAIGWLRKGKRARWLVRAMVIYAVVQGGLFASFLPPA